MSKITKPEKVGFSSEKLENIGESMRSLIEDKENETNISYFTL